MSLEYRNLPGRCEILLHNDGTFKSARAEITKGVFDTALDDWASPPTHVFEKYLTLEQLKLKVAGLE